METAARVKAAIRQLRLIEETLTQQSPPIVFYALFSVSLKRA
jgi:hypothetical protein